MSLPNLVYPALARVVYPVFNKKVTVEGTEHLPISGGFILACNHVDWLDGFYIAATIDTYRHLPTYFVSISNNYWWTGVTMQIPRDRTQVIEQVISHIRAGKIICNFPEGHRNATNILAPGKTGTVRMAAEAGAPVIPVGITCEAGKSMGQSLRFLFSSAHAVRLAFGPPLTFLIPPGGITAEWLHAETQRLMQAIAPLAHKQV